MKNQQILYSVVLVKESLIYEHKNKDDTKIFEESIILIKCNENFFENSSQEELLLYFNDKIPPLEYINAYEEKLKNYIVCVIDYFEIIDEMKIENFIEVYNRNFIETKGTSLDDIINKYYGGFVFKK